MIIYTTTESESIAGTLWPKGTRLSAPDAVCKAAVENGLASFDPPGDAAKSNEDSPPHTMPDKTAKAKRAK